MKTGTPKRLKGLPKAQLGVAAESSYAREPIAWDPGKMIPATSAPKYPPKDPGTIYQTPEKNWREKTLDIWDKIKHFNLSAQDNYGRDNLLTVPFELANPWLFRVESALRASTPSNYHGLTHPIEDALVLASGPISRLATLELAKESIKRAPMVKKALGKTADASAVRNQLLSHGYYEKKGGAIDTPYGQWQYPGEVTRVPSNNITMKGVNYPVYGKPNKGPGQMMYPEGDYYYPDATNVTEYPVMKSGGLSPSKAREMLINPPHGKPLTAKQKRYFGMIYGRSKKQAGGMNDHLSVYPMAMNKGGQPCYDCGGPHMQTGGNQNESMPESKKNSFLTWLRNTSYNRLVDDISSEPFHMRLGGEKNAAFNGLTAGTGWLAKHGGDVHDKPGGSNVGKKRKTSGAHEGPFVGPSGGAPAGSYPVTNPGQWRAAKAYARHAPNPSGIKAAADRIAKKKGWMKQLGGSNWEDPQQVPFDFSPYDESYGKPYTPQLRGTTWEQTWLPNVADPWPYQVQNPQDINPNLWSAGSRVDAPTNEKYGPFNRDVPKSRESKINKFDLTIHNPVSQLSPLNIPSRNAQVGDMSYPNYVQKPEEMTPVITPRTTVPGMYDRPEVSERAPEKTSDVTQQVKVGRKNWKDRWWADPDILNAGMEGITNIANYFDRKQKEKQLRRWFTGDNQYEAMRGSRGDYTPNYGYFRPDQMTPVQFAGQPGLTKYGGEYKSGGEYYMGEDEIQRILQSGGEIEYLDE